MAKLCLVMNIGWRFLENNEGGIPGYHQLPPPDYSLKTSIQRPFSNTVLQQPSFSSTYITFCSLLQVSLYAFSRNRVISQLLKFTMENMLQNYPKILFHDIERFLQVTGACCTGYITLSFSSRDHRLWELKQILTYSIIHGNPVSLHANYKFHQKLLSHPTYRLSICSCSPPSTACF